MARSNYTLLQRSAPSGAEALSLLFRPAADIVFIGVTPFALALRLGLQVKIISIAQRLGMSHGIIMRKEAATGDGLVVATVAGSTGHQIAASWGKDKGFKIRFLYLPPLQQVAAFQEGCVDAISSWEPFLTRAVSCGGIKAFDALALHYPMFNVICATQPALEQKGTLIDRFLDGYLEASARIGTGEFLTELGGMPLLFSNELPPNAYAKLLRESYFWPSARLSDANRSDITLAFEQAESFLDEAGFARAKRSVDGIFGQIQTSHQDLNQETNQLTVVHTDSLMCAAYHVAVTTGTFEHAGFQVSRASQLRGQRLAQLSEESRTDAAQIEAQVLKEPVLAILGCRQKTETIFRRVHVQFLGDRNERVSSEKVIEELNEAGLFERMSVYTAAHWIRVIGNWVNHNLPETETVEDLVAKAQECLNHLLTILEWRDQDAIRFLEAFRSCRKCRGKMSRAHKCCPKCGTNQEECPGCHGSLQLTWQHCPACGRAVR